MWFKTRKEARKFCKEKGIRPKYIHKAILRAGWVVDDDIIDKLPPVMGGLDNLEKAFDVIRNQQDMTIFDHPVVKGWEGSLDKVTADVTSGKTEKELALQDFMDAIEIYNSANKNLTEANELLVDAYKALLKAGGLV